jgi:hypothetical protein
MRFLLCCEDNIGCPWNPVIFLSSDGEVEFAKEGQGGGCDTFSS